MSALHGPQAQGPVRTCPERLHDEITADYNGMIYAMTPEEIEACRKAFIQMEAQASRRRRQPGGSRRTLVYLHAPAAEPMAQRAHHQCNRAAARRVQRRIKTQTV